MALNWNWKDKIGEIEYAVTIPDEGEKKYTLSLYEGNAYLIMIHEYKDEKGADMYELFSFFTDYDHMKNRLGLNKKGRWTENLYETPYKRFTKISINKAKCSHTKTIVEAFAEAFSKIQIEVYTEKEEE